MKNIDKIKDRSELFDFVFLADLICTQDEAEKNSLIYRAMKKAEQLGVSEEFAKQLSHLEKLREKEEEEQRQRELTGENGEPERDKNGFIKKTIDNYLIILLRDERFESLRFNELTGRGEADGKALNDAKISVLTHYIEKKYALKSERDFDHALKVLFQKRRYHPVREKIESITWDKKPRIENFLQFVMLAEDSDYTRECSRLIFHCGIARIFNPGCKVDDVIVLQGEQGNGKSTLTSWLAMKDDWYGRISEIRGNTGIEQIQGKWICEISELLAVSGRERQEEAKQYLDRKSDNYRRPYAQFSEEIPRQCIFIGTTNLRQPFTDKTGNRRYYPVWCSIKPGELYERENEVKSYIEQCWAEAYDLWQRGLIRHAVKKEMLQTVSERQKSAAEDDWRVGVIESYLESKNETCVIEIWMQALSMPDRPSNRQSREIGLILDNLDGWEKGDGNKRIGKYEKQRYWQKKSGAKLVRVNEENYEIIDT